MNNIKYNNMLLRRRFCKRILLMITVFILSFYIAVMLFGKGPQIIHFTDLNRCPACYGVSVCPELYSSQIMMSSSHWSKFFNTKNIYYGYTKSNKKVMLKKLAHQWELEEFDSNLCKTWNLDRNCKPVDLLQVSNIEKKIINLVEYNLTRPDVEPRKGLIICPYAYSIHDFIKPILNKKNEYNKSELLNIWTMLSVNPEPIILQVIPKSKGWPVPAYGGVCGRLEVVAHEGELLSSQLEYSYRKNLIYAKKILRAALDFTFKHERFRFYLMDWSLDNIVANDKDEISFVDLEDIIVLDKNILPKKDLSEWYNQYTRENIGSGFTFSIKNICSSHLSDHNVWAACYVLAAGEDALLFPIPPVLTTYHPQFKPLLKTCLNGNDDRFATIQKLINIIDDIMGNLNIFGLSGDI